jgi:hypothetical protein
VYGRQTEFLSLRDENRLRVCRQQGQRKLYGLERDKVAGGLRILHKDELYNIGCSRNIIGEIKSRRMRCAQAER